jgi:multidrug efflux pump subunit AcrA (membrane-fusion protein)
MNGVSSAARRDAAAAGASTPPPARRTRRLEDNAIRSEDVREILEATPTALLRQGVVVVVVAALLGIALTWWIRWPEVVDGRVTVTSKDPPASVAARADGRIERLYVREGDRVERGATLAILESSATGEHVLALRDALAAIERAIDSDGPRTADAIRADWELGDLRGLVIAFVQSVEDERTFRALPQYELRRRAFEHERERHGLLDRALREERELVSRTVTLLEQQASRDTELAERGAIAHMARDEVTRRLVDERARLKELEAAALRNQLAKTASERSGVELEQLRAERDRALDRAVRESLRRLQGAVADWTYRFVLRAPTTGRVSFFDVWSADQRVRAGEEVLYVVPESMELVGRVSVHQQGAGRIGLGQRVRVRFDSYPTAQFGTVTATVSEISAAARGSELVVGLALPGGLRTSYGRELAFKQGMSGTASIITEDLRLVNRLLGPLRDAIVNGPASQRAAIPHESRSERGGP